MTISAVIIARNEEQKIEDCIRSINWVDEIILIDTESEDKTAEIAKRYRAKVYSRALDNFSNQKNFGIEKANSDWILSIDADEVASPELRDSILNAARNPGERCGFYLWRKNYIFGKCFRFGGNGPEKLLRLFKKGRGEFQQPIHEKVVVNGDVGELKGDLLHFSTSSFVDYKRKLHLYTDFEAEKMNENKIKAGCINLYVKPVARFLYFYFLKLGFLDGAKGFFYQVLSSYYLYLKYKKLNTIKKVQKK